MEDVEKIVKLSMNVSTHCETVALRREGGGGLRWRERGAMVGKGEGETEANLRNTDIHKSGKSFKYFLHTENYLEEEEN